MKLGMSNVALTRMRAALRPIFEASLTRSLQAVGNGSTTPTYSRATTAYVQDHEGMMRQCVANEPRFWGARRVHNLVSGSNALSSGWVGANGTTRPSGITGSDGKNYGKITCSGSADQQWSNGFTLPTGTSLAGRSFTFSVTVWTDASQLTQSPNDYRLYVFDALLNTIVSQAFTLTTTPTQQYITVTFPTTLTGTNSLTVRIDPWDTVNTPPAGLYLAAGLAQLEETTGASANTPSEYLESGSTDYIGSGVFGIKYFDTVRLHKQNLFPNSSFIGGNGTQGGWSNTGPGLSSTIGAQNVVVNGVTTNIMSVRSTVGGYQGFQRFYSEMSPVPQPGQSLTMSCWLRRVAGVTVSGPLMAYGGTINNVMATAATINAQPAGVWVKYTFSYALPAGDLFISFIIDSGLGGAGDGFDIALPQLTRNIPTFLQANTNNYLATTDTSGSLVADTGLTAPIPSTTMLGKVCEAAGTQLVTPTAAIRDLTDASWTKTAMTVAKTSSGVDGISSGATRCTASGANATALQAAPVTAAGWYVTSFYIRRVTGTGNIDITVDGGTTWSTISGGINNATYTRVSAVGNLALNTARIGLRIATNGDAVDVDFSQLEACAGAGLTGSTPMATAGASRNDDASLTYPVTGNFDATKGAAYWELALSSSVAAAQNYGALVLSGVPGYMGLVAGNPNYGMYDGTNFFVTSGTLLGNFVPTPGSGTWDSGGQRLAGKNQSAGTGPFTGSYGAVTALAFGSNPAAGTIYFQRNCRIYGQRLAAAQQDAMVA